MTLAYISALASVLFFLSLSRYPSFILAIFQTKLIGTPSILCLVHGNCKFDNQSLGHLPVMYRAQQAASRSKRKPVQSMIRQWGASPLVRFYLLLGFQTWSLVPKNA